MNSEGVYDTHITASCYILMSLGLLGGQVHFLIGSGGVKSSN